MPLTAWTTTSTFQSTPPVKAATAGIPLSALEGLISIHAAREGGDCDAANCMDDYIYISIHAAREGGDYTMLFLYNIMEISIHAAREGGDGGNV